MGALTAPLPSYIAIGPTRTATTWLHQVLESHIGPACRNQGNSVLRLEL